MGGKSGGNEAAYARQQEQERQGRIRQGTSAINDTFDKNFGSGYKPQALGADTAYDPKSTYYKADGTAWGSPQTASSPQNGSDGGGLGAIFGQINNGAQPDQNNGFTEQQFREALARGEVYQGGGFFDNIRNNFTNYASPQLEQQYGDAQKQLTFSLARNGTLDSSVRGAKAGELQQKYDLNKQQIADQALSHETQARTSVEDARANLIASLNATGDAQGAANAALARSTALSQPQAYNPMTNLFADFTSGLGTQAALERANYYSGGQTGARYNTGIFAPNNNAVTVKK